MTLLRVSGLRTSFETDAGVARAVDGVDFEVGEGEAVGLVGESGCGKTVTGLSLAGLVPPPGRIRSGSSVRWRGEELVGASETRLRAVRGREIGYAFQEPAAALDPVFTVGEQIAEGVRHHMGASRAEARARATELLREMGLPEPERQVDAYPHELSGGMRQRAQLASALACDPALLVADEPTTALDVTVQARILDLLIELGERRGLALLLITHDLDVVAAVCDRVMVMYAGQIVESGPVEKVLRRPFHPYTRGLLGSHPRLGDRRSSLRPIPGRVPAATGWPPGCRFHPRCAHAWERCRSEDPRSLPKADVGGGPGEVRCWLVLEPERRGAEGEG